LRIVSWNCCRRGFASTIEALKALNADLAFLQEVGRPATRRAGCVWSGRNPRQGVAVVALTDRFTLREYDSTDITAPVHVNGAVTFEALNVWAQPKPSYPGHVNSTLDRFRHVLLGATTVVAGDFNSTVTADTARKPLHANLVARLRDEFGLVSAYHHVHDLAQGREPTATYFHLRKPAAPYYIDFCFVPLAWMDKVVGAKVFEGNPWSVLSDHRPLVVEIAFDDRRRTFATRPATGKRHPSR
jgi:endonuclease/exonuclease/phosphatase family metal-dependent hydrolase